MTRMSAAVLTAALTITTVSAVGTAGVADAANRKSIATKYAKHAKHARQAKHTKHARRAKHAKAPSYDQLVKTYHMAPGSLGFLAIDADSGRVIAARVPDAPFIPASSIKAATAVAALNILGGAYRFSTEVHTKGSVKDGVLHGDVILRGRGDPTLTIEGLEPLIAALKSKGIKSIKGRFLYDATMFPTQKAIDIGEDTELAYNPGIGPLSLNFNRVRLRWTMHTKNGPLVQVISKTDRTEVPVDFVGAGIAPAGVHTRYGVAYDAKSSPPRWLLTKGARRRGEMWLPVKRPGIYVADVFRRRAAQEGIRLPAPVAGKLPPDADLVAKHDSKPLTTILRKVLKYSNNMAAETIGVVTARRQTGKPLGVTPAALAMGDWYKKILPQTNWSGLLLENHSGLSTRSRITARQMVAILRYARRQTYAGRRLIDLLRPYWVAGRRLPSHMSVATVFKGKRRRRGKRGPVVTVPRYVTVRAKTGTLSWSRALAGYLTTVGKKNVVFALFISDYRAQEVADKNGTSYTRLSRGRWAWRSRALMRAVVLKWILEN
jgi:D-alanyl-D-alanine carboxypeptidase/D-alanyl-D-alanine-endopeptidase (penicillin-binding protein 4)